MFDGKIDGNFILAKGQSIAQAVIDELGIKKNEKEYGSIFNQIDELCKNKSNYQISGENSDIITFTKECWSKIVAFVNSKIPTEKIQSQITNNFDKIGKECISYWNNEFNGVESDTRCEMDVIVAKRNGDEDLAKQLEEKLYKVNQIYQNNKEYYEKTLPKLDLTEVIQWFKDNKYANCADRSIVIQDYLNKKGIKNNVIEIHSEPMIRENKTPQCVDHQFNVIGLDEKADISDPSTWGDNAVIIDAWSGDSYPAKEGWKLYQKLWDFNNADITNHSVVIVNHN